MSEYSAISYVHVMNPEEKKSLRVWNVLLWGRLEIDTRERVKSTLKMESLAAV